LRLSTQRGSSFRKQSCSRHARLLVRSIILMVSVLEELQHFLEAEFANSLALDGSFCQFSFGILQIQDALFDRVFDGHLVHDDVDCLVESMDSINGLLFDKLLYDQKKLENSQR
jgi:hypothetical protein